MTSDNIEIRKLVEPTDDEIEAVVDLIRTAFTATSDPFVTACLGGDLHNAALCAAFVRCFVLGALVPGEGEVWVAEVAAEGGERKVVGEVVWWLPGHGFMESEAQRERVPWGEFVRMLSPEKARWLEDYCLPRLHNLWERTVGPGVLDQQYHLQIVSVLHAYENRGLMGALVLPVFQRAVQDRKRVLGEATTWRNVRKYVKIGCQVLGEEEFDCEWVGEGTGGKFSLWPVELMPQALSENAHWNRKARSKL